MKEVERSFFFREGVQGEILIRDGQLCEHLFFITSGMLRAFYLDERGKEYTVMFAVADWWITDMHCYLNHRPAMVSVEALEKSHLLGITKKDLDALFEEIPTFNVFFRKLMERAYCREQLRVLNNLTQPALVRY